MKTIIITGGAGFIGSHVVRLFVTKYPEYKIINLDALTYAGNLENLKDIEDAPNYIFEKVNILDANELERVFTTYTPDSVIHLAAESHVDRSISSPLDFVYTNVLGTVNLLNAAKKHWNVTLGKPDVTLNQEDVTLSSEAVTLSLSKGEPTSNLFYHISTDEVYGALGDTGFFTEETPYDPHSPYSASKASSDHFVRAYHDTYGLPVIVSNCSNNYGPNHFPEKLIPLMINNVIHKKPLPVYGDGLYTRDWLFVKDHARAIDVIFHKGKIGET